MNSVFLFNRKNILPFTRCQPREERQFRCHLMDNGLIIRDGLPMASISISDRPLSRRKRAMLKISRARYSMFLLLVVIQLEFLLHRIKTLRPECPGVVLIFLLTVKRLSSAQGWKNVSQMKVTYGQSPWKMGYLPD